MPADLQNAAKAALHYSKAGQVGLNRLMARARHLFNWAIERGHRDDTPFRRHGVSVIRLDRLAEGERTRRLYPGEEDRLAAAAGPRLRALIIAALSTGCRVGELLSLQWKQVRFDGAGQPREFLLPATKTKTSEARVIPISPRLRAVLEMRRTDPRGEPLGPDAFVFGNEIGERLSSIREAWERACKKAGIVDLHFHDLRREFACALLESRAPLHHVQAFLGHANISTTSRYLKATARGMADDLDRMERGTVKAEAHERELAALRGRLAELEAAAGTDAAVEQRMHKLANDEQPAATPERDPLARVTVSDVVN